MRPIEGTTINHGSLADVGFFFDRGTVTSDRCVFRTANNLYNWQFKIFSELEITSIVGRHSHNSTCSIVHQYVIGNPDRYPGVIYGINRVSTRKYARLLTGGVLSLYGCFSSTFLYIFTYCITLFLGAYGVDQQVFRC